MCVGLFATFSPAYQSDFAESEVSGLWLFDVTTSIGNGEPLVLLEQTAGDLRGHYTSRAWGEVDLTGQIDDLDLTFSLEITNAGAPFTVIYTAVLTDHDRMEGIVKIGSSQSGAFTGQRQRNPN